MLREWKESCIQTASVLLYSSSSYTSVPVGTHWASQQSRSNLLLRPFAISVRASYLHGQCGAGVHVIFTFSVIQGSALSMVTFSFVQGYMFTFSLVQGSMITVTVAKGSMCTVCCSGVHVHSQCCPGVYV